MLDWCYPKYRLRTSAWWEAICHPRPGFARKERQDKGEQKGGEAIPDAWTGVSQGIEVVEVMDVVVLGVTGR